MYCIARSTVGYSVYVTQLFLGIQPCGVFFPHKDYIGIGKTSHAMFLTLIDFAGAVFYSVLREYV